jgi:phosphatidylserine decarboxylase
MHQFVERDSGEVRTERLFGDRWIRLLYGRAREDPHWLLRALTSRRATVLLAMLHYDLPLVGGGARFLRRCGVDLGECVGRPRTARELFERRIRYWETRPMPEDPSLVVSPADARAIPGSFTSSSSLFLKEKFFDFEELLGAGRRRWLRALEGGDYAVFRLTPEKYHWNHAPVSGRVLDRYAVQGRYHSCNPQAVAAGASPLDKNRRVVTILDTDEPGGTGVGIVAMVEVVALMIGEVVSRYSEERYEDPRPVERGMWLRRGAPMSLFRPGSSTDVLLFEPGRVRLSDDLLSNSRRADVRSRFTGVLGRPAVETDLRVRSAVAARAGGRNG